MSRERWYGAPGGALTGGDALPAVEEPVGSLGGVQDAGHATAEAFGDALVPYRKPAPRVPKSEQAILDTKWTVR